MTAEQFLLALRRFIARRGKLTQIILDNAPQFKLAKTAIDKAWKGTISHHEVQSYTANQGTEWNFIVELAPWMGSICLPQKSPRATFCHFCSHFALSLLDKILTPLKGRNEEKNLVCRLAFPHPFLPASKHWWLHRQNNWKLPQVSLLADWFIVHLGIVVT